jgi:MFS family permease
MSQPNSSAPNQQTRAIAHDPYAALRHRDFLLYMFGWVFNVIGGQITEVAVGWDLYQRTHNPMALAWVGLVSEAPVILLALPAGQLADHFDRRRIVLASQMLATCCSIGLAYLSYIHGPLIAMYGVLLVVAVCRAI